MYDNVQWEIKNFGCIFALHWDMLVYLVNFHCIYKYLSHLLNVCFILHIWIFRCIHRFSMPLHSFPLFIHVSSWVDSIDAGLIPNILFYRKCFVWGDSAINISRQFWLTLVQCVKCLSIKNLKYPYCFCHHLVRFVLKWDRFVYPLSIASVEFIILGGKVWFYYHYIQGMCRLLHSACTSATLTQIFTNIFINPEGTEVTGTQNPKASSDACTVRL